MSSRLVLAGDRVIKHRLYPALAVHQARPFTQAWRQFDQHWPYTTSVRLEEYCLHSDVDLELVTLESVQDFAWYAIGLSFFDFNIDYIGLLPRLVQQKVQECSIKLLFYYHEGDHPGRIKNRLDDLVRFHRLPVDCYVFVSANTACRGLERFVWFADFEMWYYHRNREQSPVAIHAEPRYKDFTVLVRTHKSWRATVMADLHNLGLLNSSHWSYCQQGIVHDVDNPIEIDAVPDLRRHAQDFIDRAPFYADGLTDSQRNDHAITVQEHYADAYVNIVLETHMDADQSCGSFITEKSFKPIKHGQIFFIAGTVGSLQQLRDLGYKTFDHVIDTGYDSVLDTTQRWLHLRRSIQDVYARGLHNVFLQCLPDIQHNQQMFVQDKTARLNTLIEQINDYR